MCTINRSGVHVSEHEASTEVRGTGVDPLTLFEVLKPGRRMRAELTAEISISDDVTDSYQQHVPYALRTATARGSRA
ncbi:MAG: hypothetical protein WBP81_27940 [Solirubrobacteraceae bacterium]